MHDWIYYWWVMFHSKTFKMNLKTWWNLSTGYIFNLILSCLRARTISLPWEHSQNWVEDEPTDEKSASNYILPVMIECLDCTRNPFFPFDASHIWYCSLICFCSGLTHSNYKELNVLYEKYKSQGQFLIPAMHCHTYLDPYFSFGFQKFWSHNFITGVFWQGLRFWHFLATSF